MYIMCNMINIINTAVCYIWKLVKVNPMWVLMTKKIIFSIYSIILSIWDDGYLLNICGNYFMFYVGQILMLIP